MFESYLIGLAGIVLLSVAWLAVQSGWRKVFPSVASDPDALAGRMGCHGCAGPTDCVDGCNEVEEELR
jgi:hypothetical protein